MSAPRVTAASRTAAARTTDAPLLDVDALLDDPATQILVCCGSGGVGKTTTAAALAVRAAERGRHVVVLTIDPARRLAQALGLDSLGNEPEPVVGIDGSAGGDLQAMMLDMKRTFDQIVFEHVEPAKAQAIMDNPFYQSLSSSFAGTQEYMAMERLGQLRAQAAERGWDLIVVDTPPSRSALDFLDAPERLGRFLDGRFIRMLTAPARGAGRTYLRLVTAGVGLFAGVLTKLLGNQLLKDMQAFISAMDTTFGGFRERAERTFAMLQAPGTAFLVVASPERDALREASYFVERLRDERMPLAGLLLNRVHRVQVEGLTSSAALAAADALASLTALVPAEASSAAADTPANLAAADSGAGSAHVEGAVDNHARELTEGLLRLHALATEQASRERMLAERFTAAHRSVPVAEIPAQATDVHDLNGLREVGRSAAVFG